MDNGPQMIEVEQKNPEPLFEIKIPKFTKKSMLGRFDIEINRNVDTREDVFPILMRQRNRLEAIFSEVADTGDSNQLRTDLEDNIKGKMSKAVKDNDEHGQDTALADMRFIEAQFNLYESYKDSLTGLYRRSGLIETLNMIMKNPDLVFGEELVGLKGRRITILMTDLDNFKDFNEHHGYGIGDIVLREYAAATAEGVRKSDLVGRWGGEEDVVIFFGDPSPELADARIFGKVLEMNKQLKEQIPNIDRGLADPDRPAITFSAGAVSVEWNYIEKALRGGIIAKFKKNDKGENVTDEYGVYEREIIETVPDRELTTEEKAANFSDCVLYLAEIAMKKAKKEGKNTIRVAGSD